MGFGENLMRSRKKSGLSQEEVAAKLGVSRQTVSKWELGETLPDIQQAKKLSTLYHITLDELVELDLQVKEIQEVIEKTTEETQKKIDWTAMWAKKYPVLASYPQEVNLEDYVPGLKAMLARLEQDYHYHRQNAFLVLKDILAQIWNRKAKLA